MASRENARRFHFLREIASGGFGTVYLCKVHHADGFTRLAAVKILKQQWTDTAEVVKRIRDEARLLGLLRHRAIVTVYDLTSIDGRAAVVMEYIEGVDLRTVVKSAAGRIDAGDGSAQVPVRAALDVGSAVASALDAAYNRPPMPGEKPLRVIHRDIKPSNIMVDGQGDVKVLDFGVARSDIENRESHTEELQFGSVDYMAPERLFFEPETPAGDVYGLGATLYELLALQKLGKARGRPEQHAAMVEDQLSFLQGRLRVRGTVATELVDVLRASLAWRHEDRPTAAELQQRCRALARLVEDEDLPSWAEREIPPLFEAASRRPRKPNPLDDSVRTEDSISRARTGGFAEPPADARLAEAVQRGALRELEDSSAFERSPDAPAAGRPGPGAYQTLEPPDDPADDPADDWDDIPTHIGSLDDPTAAPEPLSQDLRPGAGPAVNPQAFAPPTGAPARRPPLADSRHTMIPEDPSDVAPRGGLIGPDDLDDDLDDAYAQEATAVDVDEDGSAAGFDEALPGPVAVAGLDESHSVTATADGPTPMVQPAPTPVTRRPGKRPVVMGALAGGCLLFVVSAVVSIGLAALVSSGTLTLPARPGAETPASPLAEVAEAEEAPVEVAEGDEAAAEEAAAEAAPVPASAALVFESRAPDTRKLRVVCTDGEAKGEDTATVAVAAAERCTVTAIMQDRSRMVAVVDGAEAGTYGCFADGASACERE